MTAIENTHRDFKRPNLECRIEFFTRYLEKVNLTLEEKFDIIQKNLHRNDPYIIPTRNFKIVVLAVG